MKADMHILEAVHTKREVVQNIVKRPSLCQSWTCSKPCHKYVRNVLFTPKKNRILLLGDEEFGRKLQDYP